MRLSGEGLSEKRCNWLLVWTGWPAERVCQRGQTVTDSTETMDGAPGQAEPAVVLPLDEVDRQAFAERLVAEAQSSGVRLIGPGGLLADVAKRVIETGLEVEMTEHLGYAKHAADG